ncbi:class I SAM-dependent methyltransferase [Flavihumibacter rivuli]|uniref:class I SAM-dependent methyltransferase n=1 Tax=Flavihumibacter rivuli TaxID=2838156 RepID=UPI001BDEFD18|nr:class I SAM-dependent methyltransferase [Flavihumibacter rivuli]ULQ57422.1 class I SAM-dependent methyltransferase [Flavihumibacter rivuli]
MGFDCAAIRLLLYHKKNGRRLGRTLTLGRQSFQLESRQLLSCLKEFGHSRKEFDALIGQCGQYVEPFLSFIGATTTESLDASSYENATYVHDMNAPIPKEWEGQFDTVIDAGTLEHVFNFPQAISNAMKLLKPGGYFIMITTANNFFGHGFYQFSPELFFRVFDAENGFETKEVFLSLTGEEFSWYKIPDPKAIRSRVIMENARKTYLLGIAQKVSEGELFRSKPQQSDYEWISWKDENFKTDAIFNPNANFSTPALLIKRLIALLRKFKPIDFFNVIFRPFGNGRKDLFKKVKL